MIRRSALGLLLILALEAVPASAAGAFSAKQAEGGPAAPQSQKKVEIFVTSWCPYCRKLESFLKQNDISYTRYDVEKDETGSRIFSEIGGTGVPVIRVGSKVIYGFDLESLVAALQANG